MSYNNQLIWINNSNLENDIYASNNNIVSKMTTS